MILDFNLDDFHYKTGYTSVHTNIHRLISALSSQLIAFGEIMQNHTGSTNTPNIKPTSSPSSSSSKVIGIETSCDETGVAIYDSHQGIIANQLYSQIAVHADYGGVVPELASRDHIRKTIPLLEQALQQANCHRDEISAIAYTTGPGLIGSLLVGTAIGRSIAYAWNIPAIAVHHMEGHLLAPLLEASQPKLPFIALLVSGGHTMLVRVSNIGEYQILGESIDDAAGEAFDKTAKLLDLDYPGGPKLAELAKSGIPGRFQFPRPMTNKPGLNFSFSGLKTFAANTIAAQGTDQQTKADIAHAFQQAVADTLVIKCRRALEQTQINQLVVAGGVSANQYLRQALQRLMTEYGGSVYYPRPEFCTDNGAMIAFAGMKRWQAGQFSDLSIKAKPRWPLDLLPPLITPPLTTESKIG